MSSLVLFNHLVFAAAILGVSIVLVVAVMTAIFFRHFANSDDLVSTSAQLTPSLRTGGVAIVGAFLAAILLIHLLGDFTPIKDHHFWGFLASLSLISATCLYSTFKPLDERIKFFGQMASAAIVMSAGVVIDEIHLPWLGWVVGGWWVYPMTLFWILGLTNVYNRMDGVDGLAASSAVVASAFLIFISFHQESVFVYLCSVALFAASVGFLAFNWPPAKIFMGEIGSTFLGFSFAVMAIIAALYDRSHTSLFVVPLLLLHFIFDAAFAIFVPLSGKMPGTRRPHLYNLLVSLGYPHRRVILTYVGMGVAQGFGAIWMVNIQGDSRVWVFVPFLLIQFGYAYWLVSAVNRRKLL